MVLLVDISIANYLVYLHNCEHTAMRIWRAILQLQFSINIDLMGMFLRILPEIESVHILPYHNYHQKKYPHLDRERTGKRIKQPSADNVDSVKKRLQSFGLTVEIGG